MNTEEWRITASVVAGVVGVTGGILLGGTAGDLTIALGAFALVTTVCLVIIRAARQLHRSQVRAERQAQAHHKRASEWNFHLTETLGGRGAARPSVAPAPAVSRVTEGNAWKGHKQAAELIASRVFDAELYSAVVGREFALPTEAASHYLSINAGKGVMPIPLIDSDRLPDTPRAALRRGDVRPLLQFLRTDAARAIEFSSLFNARLADVSAAMAATHPGGIIGAFVAASDGSAALPLEPDSALAGTTWNSVRELLLQHARAFYAAVPPDLPRTQSTWDFDAERRWLSATDASLQTDSLKVSVIMPVKDRAGVITEAITSVVAQTHQNWELIVVDDGSSDGTADVVRELAEQEPRITVRDSVAHGVSAARNTGLAAAQGTYVAFLDSDNKWVPHFLKTSLRAMIRDDLGAAYAAVALGGDQDMQYRAFQGTRSSLLMLNHIDLNVLVVRADIASGVRFDETLRRWVDHDYAIKIGDKTDPVLLPFIGCHYDHSVQGADRITVRESDHWQWVALSRHWVRWDLARDVTPGRVSVVIPTYNDSAMTIRAVNWVLADAKNSAVDVEIIVVDNGSRIEVGQALLANLGSVPEVTYHRLARNLNFAIGSNVGAVMATGEYVFFLNNDTEVRGGVLRRLMIALEDSRALGAQPLLLYPDETIQTAGTVFTARAALPSHLLVGHPPADARGISTTPFAAVTAAALMMRTDQVRALHGFDPLFVNGMEDVDLCFRARAAYTGHFVVVPDAVVTHLESKTPGRGANIDENRRLFLERWHGKLPSPQDDIFGAAGFQVAHVGTDGRTVPAPVPIVVRDTRDLRRRWGINIASIPGARGDMWGDTHFADSLRMALEENGESAVVHRHGSHQSLATAFDDVSLVLRGLDRVHPMPGKVNILWVISHPDDVTVAEIQEFDLVFAASKPWASHMSVASGRNVIPLLQATDPAHFHDQVDPEPLGVPLFVGGVHPGRVRPIVRDSLDAGIEFAVYGPGWGEALPEGVLRGKYIANSELASYYRGAKCVLTDHWSPMAREGFIQNRLFDAVASGARVIADRVEGVDELFEGAVRTYGDIDQLVRLLDDPDAFPDREGMSRIAEKIRREHSFTQRARQLIEYASRAIQ